jgi:hypothetical protein
MLGGVAAHKLEHSWSAQAGVQSGISGDDMKMQVLESFGLGEQRHIRLLASGHLVQGVRRRLEQRAEFRGLLGRGLVQGGQVPMREHHEPPGQCCPERVRDTPSSSDIDPLSRRHVGAPLEGAAQAVIGFGHV